MPSLSPRENYLRALRHKETEYVPFNAMAHFAGGDAVPIGLLCPAEHGDESSSFRDGFGVRWEAANSAAGQALPAPGEFVLKDVTRWKRDITKQYFPGSNKRNYFVAMINKGLSQRNI